jgi:uncharacterized protein (TIGR03437 family)
MNRYAVGFWICATISGSSMAVGQTGIIATVAGYGGSSFSGDGGPATSAALNAPSSVTVDASGNFFIADTNNQRIRKVSASGIITTVAGNGNAGFSGDNGLAVSASLNFPSAVKVDSSGNLYIADTGNQRVRKVSTSGTITTVAGSGFGPFAGDGGPATSALLNSPFGIALDASGNLFIADSGNNRIRKVSTGGTITTVAGNGRPGSSGDGGQATAASLGFPRDVVVDGSGNLFLTDSIANLVRKVSPDGIITTVAGNGTSRFSGDGGPALSAGFEFPTSLALDGVGNLLIAGYGGRVRSVSSDGIVTTIAGNGIQGFSGDLGPATAAMLGYSVSVTVAPSGNLFMADAGNNRIREISAAAPATAATLSADPAHIDVFAPEDFLQTQKVQIGGVAGTHWQAGATTSGGGPWLSVSAAGGTAPAELTLAINTTGLANGTYLGSINIQAPDAIPPSLRIDVRLQVYFVPTVAHNVSNAASLYVSGQNGFGIALGSRFLVAGTHLGPAVPQQTDSFPIPLSLGGTSLQIKMQGAAYDAPIISASYGEVTALLPSSVPVGDGMLMVTFKDGASSPIPIHIVKGAFGIFATNPNGAGTGDIRDVNGEQVTFSSPAHPGDIVTLRGTGLGAVSGLETDGPLPGNQFTPDVFVGNRPASVQYAGRSECCAGLDEIILQIPSDVPGCFVPVAVRTNGVTSNFVTLPIAPEGQACSDPVGLTPDLLTLAAADTGVKIGIIVVGPMSLLENFGASFEDAMIRRVSSLLGVQVSAQDVRAVVEAGRSGRSRAMRALIRKYAAIMRARHVDPAAIVKITAEMNYQGVLAGFLDGMVPTPLGSQIASTLPSPGTCTSGLGSQYRQGGSTAGGEAQDAGPQLLFTGPSGSQMLEQTSIGSYQLALGSASAGGLAAGTYFLSSSGGNDVGPFQAVLQVGESLKWTNKDSIPFVDRSAPLTVNWSGGPASGYVVFGGGGKSADGAQVAFTCVADVRSQTLTVPDFVLGAVPHTSNGSLFLSYHPLQNLFTAPGLDVGFFADLNIESRNIAFQ